MAYFDALSREYFNKRIESGRNEVWSHVVELIKEKPFWGWGGGLFFLISPSGTIPYIIYTCRYYCR